MKPETFRECLQALHWTQRGLASILDTHPTTVRRWANGEQSIPVNVQEWLEWHYNRAIEKPLPDGWLSKANFQD